MKTRAVLVERSRPVGIAALAGVVSVVTAALLVTFAPDVAPDLALGTVAFGWPFVLALAVAWTVYWRATRTEVTLKVENGAMLVDGKTRHPAGSLTRGEALVLSDTCVRVELRGRFRFHLRLELTKVATARALLGGLGLDRRLGTSQFRVRREREYAGALKLLGFVAFPLSMIIGALFGWIGAVFGGAVVLGLLFDWLRTKLVLTVGRDGLDLRSPFHRRFVAHREIRTYRRNEIGFEIVLESGELLLIDTRSERAAAEGSRTDPSYDAVNSAWAKWRSETDEAGPAAAALLARGERSASDWIAGLRGLAAAGGPVGYRVAALDEQALFGLLVDASASREQRVAAAVVLGAKEEHAPRLRVLADDVADPLVRRVTVALLDHEDDALAAELDEAAKEEGSAARAIRRP